MEKTKFGFEDLNVWQKAIDFGSKVIRLTETLETNRKHYRLVEQLESSATSIAMNIAEGKGRYSKKEFVQYLYIARGSLFETVTLLIIFNTNKWINDKQLEEMKVSANEIGKMLSGLICSIKQ
ncbi:MAG: four helix bundle protein [bacterium]|nr:four helix bundle protein [bacterium]MDD5354451.1 four helix bundle protein [bacterium]MDD5757300.1 four helix bundle protein [bacterium]